MGRAGGTAIVISHLHMLNPHRLFQTAIGICKNNFFDKKLVIILVIAE